jgi:O-acetyl-ADP-ribose deacetylase (regulator of RNase III)
MISLTKGDIFSSECQYLVNPVNCKGIMGKGLALLFKQRYPEMYVAYKEACTNKKLSVGKLTIHDNVICFPTKIDPFDRSKIEYITMGLPALAFIIKHLNITSCAIPALGCGEGGLKWFHVKEVLQLWAGSFKELIEHCRIKIYVPHN